MQGRRRRKEEGGRREEGEGREGGGGRRRGAVALATPIGSPIRGQKARAPQGKKPAHAHTCRVSSPQGKQGQQLAADVVAVGADRSPQSAAKERMTAATTAAEDPGREAESPPWRLWASPIHRSTSGPEADRSSRRPSA